MKGTFTFTDGASNQTNLTKTSNSEAKGSIFPFAKDLFRKVKQLFVQEEIIEPVVEIEFIEQSISDVQTQTFASKNAIVEAAIPDVVIKRESHSSHLNYQLNIQQMNLFTYLKRAITSSEQSLHGQFLEQFKNFLSVIVGTASDNNAPLGSAKRDFGILSNLGGSKLLSNKIFNQPAMRSWASVMFLTLFTAFGTLAQSGSTTPQPDVSVKKTISTQTPTLGQDVTYTVKVRNDGTLKATGVELTDIMPDGVAFKSVSVGGIGTTTNSTTAGVTTIVWKIGEVPATATDLTMTIVATVIQNGLHFNIAEITKEVELDFDSTPGNGKFGEDDQDVACFSTEYLFYKGDQYTITVPVGYTEVNWTKKVGTGSAVAVTSTTPGVILSADKNSIVITDITAYTEFAFTAKEKSCPVGGCCPAKFIYGPLGSIGDFVFTDTNKDGIQTLGEPGLAGIKVQLYKSDGVTLLDEVTTDVNGKYLFDSLETGAYKVKFILPSGSTFTDTGKGTTSTDSDAGADGFSGIINIDVEKTGVDKDNPTIDAGIIGNLGSIGDFVFRDDNSNGIQDAGELGIQGVTVNLYKGGVLVATVPTDATGKYNFPGLSSGTDYQVEFIAPAQSKFTKPLLGGDPTKDSDAGVGGKSGLITIDVTKPTTDILRNNPTIDAGIIPLGSIGDYVFNDNNKDGIQNAGDTPVAGLKVYLLDKDMVKIDSTNTAADGSYKFLVPSGDYFVQFTKANGQSFSPTGAGTPATDSDADLVTGKSGKVTIDATKPVGDPARDNKTIDAGLVGNLGSIGDFVFRDDNSNGIQDAGEPGIAGVTVNLYKGGVIVATIPTDATGKYNFPGLSSGTDYEVEFVAPAQSKFTTPSLGGDPTKDSNAGANGKSGLITIDVTKAPTDILRNNPTIDAGIIPLGSIGDYVFNDNNGNGIQDAGDTKIVGLKVTLLDMDGKIITSDNTDADGKYNFIVPSGMYFILFDKPTGSTFSPTGAGTGATDSDADATGKSSKITIDASKPVGDPARNNKDVDAGLIPNKGTIGDFVFTDSNGNNKQDAGEPGLVGVTVELYDATGTTKLDTKVTDATGKYLFTGLESGGYKVKFILPSGKTFVTPNTGTPAEDSDAGAGGFSGVITIDVTKPLGDIGRNNLTIDAGVKADCNINAGTLATTTPNFCLPDAGSVVLTATVATSPTVPTGYSVKYVLTKGSDLVIQQVSNAPTFTVTATGEYRIHTLVYDGNSANGSFLDLSVVVPGTTKAADVLGIVTTNKLCAALDVTGVKFNINPIPAAPVFAGKTICAGETTKLGDTGPVSTGVSYAWFTSATATTPFATTQSIDVTPAVTTTYYVETTLVVLGACPSKRGSVTVTVNPKPENPVAKSTLGNDCTKNLLTVNLADAITTTPTGSVIEWHVANDVASAIITNTTTVGAGTYYAFAKSTVGGCYSGGVAVTVTITPCTCQNPATVSVSPIASVCGNTSTPVQLGATIGGGATSGTWTSNGTGTFDNATSITAKYTASAADVAKGSVEFTFTTNDPDGADPKCNAVSAKTTLTYKAKPAKPYNLRCEPVICLGDSNKLFSVSLDGTVKWYATATSTTPIGVGSDAGFVVTPTSEGVFTYWAEASIGDCISERSSISFTVKKCLTDLAVTKTVNTPDVLTAPDYLLGQTLTYSINAQNIGDANATDVKVNDILPAGVTYVSSSPVGQYNNTTGVWTIGNLNKTSNAVLLIQVTSNKIGAISNTATISGSNEDPTKLANNTSKVDIKVVEIADLSLTKTVNKSVVNTGDEIEYTITVLNSGPNTATNVEVKDKLPAGLTYVSSSTLTESAGTLTGIAASIAKGASATFTFKAKVAVAGKITNLAEVTKSDQKDPDSTPGNASTKPGEDDDSSVDINSTFVCNIEKPTIACGCTQKTICLGSETTLTASGCVGSSFVWSNGGTTSSITVSPKTNQTYTVYCQKDNCKSESSNAVEVKVIVVDSPLLAAAPSKICAGESTTLTATGCGGIVEWQTSPKQTGPQIIVKPSVSETFKAVCKEFDCISAVASVDVIVTPNPKAPEIVCKKAEICPGETITMTAMNCNGQVKWSTGQETTTITVFPTVTSSYTVTCSVNGCTSEPSAPFVLTVKPVEIPTIKTTDLIVCTGGSATLTAEGCTGKVTWFYDSKTLTGATIIVKPIATTIYYATCSTIACTSDKSSPVTVQVVNPVPPIVSSGTSTICSGSSVELSANGCDGGTITWSDGQKGAVITVKPLVSTSYTATCTIGTCVSVNSIKRNITVTDFAKPTITADRLTVCAGNTVTITANGCNGTVKWSDGVTGSPRTLTPTADVKYTATCESATCKSDVSNELAIKVNTAEKAPVISCPKTEICASESVTLSATGCTGTVKWSDGSTGTTITVRPSTTTTYSATCTTNTCESPKSNEKTITVNPAVVLNLTASASSPRICAGVESTLTLAGCTGTITWTGGSTGASIKVKPTETTDYTATCSGVACAKDASATVKVTVLPGATMPNITPTNTQICAGVDVTLTVNNCNGALLWSSGQTTASITVKPTVTTIYSVKCTVDGCGEAKTSEPVTVKVGTPDAPTITSVPPSVCAGGSVVLTAVGCTAGTVVWSNGKTGATLTETVNATTVYSAVCKQGTCNSPESNKVTVTVTIPSVPTISCATSTICAGSTITLIATGCEGTVKWSDGQTGAIVTAVPTKTTDYTATCTIGTCISAPSSVATVNVGNPPAPSITCNATSICQGVQITLTATNCAGTVVWNDGQVGNVITAKPNATTSYTAICKLDKCESGKSNVVTVTVGAGIKTPTTKNLNNVCPFLTVDLASGVTSTLSAGGSYEYRTGVLPTSPLVSSPNAVTTGTYYVFEKTGTGCYSAPGVINTYINADCTPKDCAKTPAIASAGVDATICAEKTYKLAGTFGGAATSIVWKTTGSGSFDNPLNPTATYRSSLSDVLAGTVKLFICTNDPDGSGPCKATADTMTLTMNGVKFKPTVAVTGNLNSCGTDSVTLTATAGTYGYKWFKVGTTTEIASTRSITVKSSGGYYFKLVDANKCCSIESDTATVNYLVAPNAPVANSVKIDRGTTVDLNKLVVSNLPAGAILVFKTGASSGSATVANPSAVGAGVYYACYKSAQGCFSLSTKITVDNKDGGPVTSTESDIQITVTTENNIALDSTVKVTITVKNNGPATGKGINVSSAIPSGLTFVTSTGGLVKNGNLLNGTLDSLISGGVKVYTWVGKISGTTTSVTVGATATSTTTDPNPNNNNGSNPNGNVVVSVPPANSSDIVVTITTDKTTYAVGDTVTTTIKVTNLGPATAKNVTVSSTVPDLLKYVSQTGGLVINGKVLTGKLDSLIKNGMKVYIYKSVLTGNGPVVISGTGTSNNPDPNPNNNNGTGTNGSVTINPTVIQGADVVITVTTDKTTYAIGDIVTTTITVKNLGPQTAKGIKVSSTLPSILEYIAQTGGLVKTGNVFTGTLDSLVKDGVKVYTYTAKVTGNGTGVVTATGTTTTTDPNPSNNNGTGTGGSVTITGGIPTPTSGADVVITVTTDKTTYAIGDIVTTTITVKNLGPQTAKGINVSSTLPSILEYIAQTGGLVKTGNVFTGTLDSLVKDGVKVYTYTAKVTGNGTATITATGTTTTTDPNPSNNNGTGTGGSVTITGGTLPAGSGADVVITITTDKATYAVGDTVTTTIKVTNLGPDVAKGINVFSVIPGTLTYIGQTGGLVKTGNLLTATIASLDKDGTVTYTYKSVLNTKSETVVAAGGTSTTKDPNPNNNNGTGATGTTTINKGDVDPTVADVAVVITADKTKAKIGEDVNFILTLTNNGPATAKQVVLVNPIPAGLTFVSSSTGQVLTSGAVSVSLDSLQKGQVRTYSYVAKMNVKTDVTNTVSVGSFKDNVGPNNFSFVTINGDTTGTVIVKDEAELALLLTADKQLIAKDDVVTFTIKVTNNGPKVATNVVVDNILPKYLTFQSGDPSQKGDTLRVATASIPVGGMVTYTYKAKVNKDTIISNTARITKTSPIDPILANNVSTVVLVPATDTTYADLGVLIAADKATYKVGDNVTYTVTLTNNGAGRAKDVQLCNPIPSGLTYVSGTGVIKAGDSVTIKVDTISKGKTRTFTYVTKATKVGTFANTVRICNSSKPDLITPNNTSTSSIKVDTSGITPPPIPTCKIDLAMAILDTVKVSTGVYNVTYRLIAKNVCKDTLKNVTLHDDLAKTFRTPVTCEITTKPTTGTRSNLIANDVFSKTDSNMVKAGSYMLPNAIDTIKYVVKVTLNGNKGPFVSNATIKGKTTGNENLIAKAKETLRFDLPNTRIGLAKEVVTTALKNDSTTYWTVPYRIRVVNMGANAITKLSVKDSLDAVFTAKGAVIVGTPIVIATPGLIVNKKYTGKGLFTDLLVPDSSKLAKGDTAIIDLTVRVNVANAPDAEKIFNNVAIGTATGTDLQTYKDISTNGNNPDKNGDKDPSNDNEATPVQLKARPEVKQVSIGIALAAVRDTIQLADSTCNVTLIMTAKNFGKDALRNVRLCTNIEQTIGKQSQSWKLVGKPVVIKGNAKISGTFNGIADSTITKSDSTFLAVGDSIVIAYMVNIKNPTKDTIYTQAIAKARSAVDTLKLTSDISMNGLKPDINGDGSPDEAAPTPIVCKDAVNNTTAFIPQGFSPNGDGTNDAFKIGGMKDTELNELIIFNRWGGVVYASADYKNDWIGQSNQGVVAIGAGQGLPDGTYFYCFTRYSKNADGTKGDKVAPEQIKSITLIR